MEGVLTPDIVNLLIELGAPGIFIYLWHSERSDRKEIQEKLEKQAEANSQFFKNMFEKANS